MFLSSHRFPADRAILELQSGYRKKEGVMVRQDYLFMTMLVAALIFFMHWGGTHHLRH
jgi:hypothetical protein